MSETSLTDIQAAFLRNYIGGDAAPQTSTTISLVHLGKARLNWATARNNAHKGIERLKASISAE
ncbi:MAG: hypothetical protein AB3N09_00250 [Tateyamaria sp.]